MSRAVLLLALATAATAPAWVWNPYHLHTLIMAGIFAVLALSLNLLLGYTGQLSLGHAAFFGIGAYATGLLTVKLEWSPWVGLLAAVVLPGAAGYVIGRLALKLRGAYFVLLTISFAGCVSLVSVNWMDLTNGPLGLPGVPPLEIALPGLPALSLRTKPAFYYVVLAAVALSYLVCRALIRSRVGRALVALRENETLAASVGIDGTHYLVLAAVALSYLVCRALIRSRVGRALVALRENETLAASVGIDGTHYLVLAAVVSAAMAGFGGGLYAHYTRFVSPEVFLFTYTVTMVIMVVAGGKGTLAGPIVGAVLFTVLPEVLRAATSWQWQMLLYGVLLVGVLFFMPEGIVPALRSAGPAARRRWSPS
jgi:branched-chain amino acid transport system permease protein